MIKLEKPTENSVELVVKVLNLRYNLYEKDAQKITAEKREVSAMMFDWISNEEYRKIMDEDERELARKEAKEELQEQLKEQLKEVQLAKARLMKADGLPTETILRYTTLSKEEIEAIQWPGSKEKMYLGFLCGC